ncbi:MAG: hypothetical protein MZU97_01065 [Bacillus subtilis]|nr:hypothetical protein [Bacillus subtilis]
MKRLLLILGLVVFLVGCQTLTTTQTTTSSPTTSISTSSSTTSPTTSSSVVSTTTTTTITTTTTSTEPMKLAAVQNIRVVSGVLMWDAVEHATTYRVGIDDIVVEVNQPFYSLSELYQRIDCDFSIVITGSGFLDSDPRVATLEHAPSLTAPTGIRIVNGYLLWNVVEEARYYLIRIDEVEVVFSGINDNPPVNLVYDLSGPRCQRIPSNHGARRPFRLAVAGERDHCLRWVVACRPEHIRFPIRSPWKTT